MSRLPAMPREPVFRSRFITGLVAILLAVLLIPQTAILAADIVG